MFIPTFEKNDGLFVLRTFQYFKIIHYAQELIVLLELPEVAWKETHLRSVRLHSTPWE